MKNTKKIELALEHFIFTSRWLLVPFYLDGAVGRLEIHTEVFDVKQGHVFLP